MVRSEDPALEKVGEVLIEGFIDLYLDLEH